MMTRFDEKVRNTYTVAEAAKVAGTGQQAIRKGIANGDIPHLRFGRRIMIPKVAFHRYLDTCAGSFKG
jgi:excisionase family DNA binding protein